jgi:Rrf2 family nitric oxide-sensitive transcriptional repressor
VCRLQGVLREASEAFHTVLDGYTLADLVHNRATIARMLFVGRGRPAIAPTRTLP